MSDSDLLEYFASGLHDWQTDKSSARESFLWCANHITGGDAQCDVHRALASLDDTCDPALAERIYATKSTWGELLRASALHYNTGLSEDALPITVWLGYLNITHRIRTRNVAHIAWAVTLLERGEYAEALRIINSAPTETSAARLVKALIYFKAARYVDVIEHAKHILDPDAYDDLDQPTGATDTRIQSVAYLLTGASYAHLGNFVTAAERLTTADAKQIHPDGRVYHYREIGAEVCYYLGLIEHAKGNDDAAADIWRQGIGYTETSKLAAALADSSVRLRRTTAELINQRASYWDVSTEPDLRAVTAAKQAETRNDMFVDAENELNRQLGMTEVKAQVERLKSKVAVALEAKRRGRNPKHFTPHLRFEGPPGTGKTTVARIVAKIYCGLGLLKKANIKEVHRADLVGAHIGETEEKTNAVIDSALDGVLFIDEAYELVKPGYKNDFGSVALGTLLTRMENERDRLVVIIAGYTKDINMMLLANDGLSSRFGRRIEFFGYNPAEIGEIAALLATDDEHELILSKSAQELISAQCEDMLITNLEGHRMLDVAGNGRFARNVIEAAAEYQNYRIDHCGVALNSLSDDEVFTLLPEDVAPALRDMVAPILGRFVSEDG